MSRRNAPSNPPPSIPVPAVVIANRQRVHRLDLRRIGESFRSTLASMMHSRVAYPARREPKDSKDAPLKRSEKSAA